MPDAASESRSHEPQPPTPSSQLRAPNPQTPGAGFDELLNWRREFPILQNTTHLISNSLGVMPRRVYDTVREYADTWAARGVRAWADSWWEMPVRLGSLLAPILGTGLDEVSFHQNVTIAEQILIDFRPGSGIRFSPHFYTADSELERIVREMRVILDTSAWRQNQGTRLFVT